MYGSLKKSFIKIFANATCCVMYDNQRDRSIANIVRRNALQIKFHPRKSHFTSFHIVCPNIHHSIGVAPVSVSLSRTELGCDGNKDKYVKVVFPYKEPGFKIVIGTQIAYKDISAELIIEWMETYKNLQVDKVVSYYHRSVNQAALKALTYYHNTGFVDLYEMVLPEEGGSQMSRVMRKPVFAYAKTKAHISCAVTAQLISAFVFGTQIVQSLYFLKPLANFCGCTARFVSDLVENPEYNFLRASSRISLSSRFQTM